MNYENSVRCLSHEEVILLNNDPVMSYQVGFFDGKMAAVDVAIKADAEIEKLTAILRQQILICRVGDQAWSKEESADKIMARLLGTYKSK